MDSRPRQREGGNGSAGSARIVVTPAPRLKPVINDRFFAFIAGPLWAGFLRLYAGDKITRLPARKCTASRFYGAGLRGTTLAAFARLVWRFWRIAAHQLTSSPAHQLTSAPV